MNGSYLISRIKTFSKSHIRRDMFDVESDQILDIEITDFKVGLFGDAAVTS